MQIDTQRKLTTKIKMKTKKINNQDKHETKHGNKKETTNRKL